MNTRLSLFDKDRIDSDIGFDIGGDINGGFISDELEIISILPFSKPSSSSRYGGKLQSERMIHCYFKSDFPGVDKFAKQCMEILNNPKGWGRAGLIFLRTEFEEKADRIIILSSAETIRKNCSMEDLNCAIMSGKYIYINSKRWHQGSKESKLSLEDYRKYALQHEMGHTFGLKHPWGDWDTPEKTKEMLSKKDSKKDSTIVGFFTDSLSKIKSIFVSDDFYDTEPQRNGYMSKLGKDENLTPIMHQQTLGQVYRPNPYPLDDEIIALKKKLN